MFKKLLVLGVCLVMVQVAWAADEARLMRRADASEMHEHFKTLTHREQEVMTYVITGMLNKQIAAELDISEETVKIHRGRVMHKLEIESVAELVRLCDKSGIAPATRRR